MSIRTSKIRGGKTNQTKSIGPCLKSRARRAATIKVPQRIELMSVDRTFRLCAIFFLIWSQRKCINKYTQLGLFAWNMGV
jgi:hypothetical protein